MRVYHGIKPETLPAPDAPDFQARTRSMLTDIDYFLRDASFGFARLIQGEIPDGSGTSIGDVSGLDGAFLLAGRPVDQIAHGGQVAQSYLALSSTTHTTKGKIYLGESMTQAAFDESTGYLGIGTVSPTVLLQVSQTAALTYARPNSETAPGGGGWRDEANGSSAIYTHMNEATRDDASYIQQQTGGTTYTFTCPDTTATNYTAITLNFAARKNTATANNLNVTLSRSGNTIFTAKNVGALTQGPGFTAGTYSFSAAEILDFNTGATNISISVSFDFGGAAPDTCAVSWFEIAFSTSSAGDMTYWTQSDGTVLLGVDSSGDVFGGNQSTSTLNLSSTNSGSSIARIQLTSTPAIIFDIPSGTVDPLTLTLGAASGTLTGRSLDLSLIGVGSNSSSFMVSNAIGSGSVVPAKVIRNASQSVDMLELLDSNGTTKLSYFDKDGIYNGPLASSSSSFVDSGFRVIGSSDATKKLAFEVDGFTTVTTRTLTPQDSSYIVAGTNLVQSFTRAQTIAPTADEVALNITPTAGATSQTVQVNNESTDVLFAINNSAVTSNVFVKNLRIDNNSGLAGGTSATIDTSGINTANRNFALPDANGQFLIRVGTVTVAPRTTTTSGTLVAAGVNPNGGVWMVNGYGSCTVAGAGSAQVNITFTDPTTAASRTYVATTINMSATTNVFPFSIAVRTTGATAITYSTTVVAGGTYALSLRGSQL